MCGAGMDGRSCHSRSDTRRRKRPEPQTIQGPAAALSSGSDVHPWDEAAAPSAGRWRSTAGPVPGGRSPPPPTKNFYAKGETGCRRRVPALLLGAGHSAEPTGCTGALPSIPVACRLADRPLLPGTGGPGAWRLRARPRDPPAEPVATPLWIRPAEASTLPSVHTTGPRTLPCRSVARLAERNIQGEV
jgi:hypothetical protein